MGGSGDVEVKGAAVSYPIYLYISDYVGWVLFIPRHFILTHAVQCIWETHGAAEGTDVYVVGGESLG